jgi:hypothetical protein
MAKVLQLPQLVEYDGVAKVDVGCGRVQPQLAAQRLSGGPGSSEFLRELRLDQQFVAPTPDQSQRVL